MKPGFQVQYEVKESIIPGIGKGIYAKEFIPMGKLIWKYVESANVLRYNNSDEVKSRLLELNAQEQFFFMTHVYSFKGFLHEILDDGKFWNHADTPNTGYGPDAIDLDIFSSYALRDIKPGEELFDDYGYYEYPEYFLHLAKEYAVTLDFFSVKEPKAFSFYRAHGSEVYKVDSGSK